MIRKSIFSTLLLICCLVPTMGCDPNDSASLDYNLKSWGCDLPFNDGDTGAPPPPKNVSATDLDAGRTDVAVSWDAVDGAASYKVYRAVYNENQNDSQYTLVGEDVTGTTFTHVEDFKADVLDRSDPFPALAPDASYDEAGVFVEKLTALDTAVRPSLYSFKAPAFYKVAACNASGCSELSAADVGQANPVHTAEYSEVAKVAIMEWGIGLLRILADVPSGASLLNWCGYDACGGGGGTVVGRVDPFDRLPMVDVRYNNYTENWDKYPGQATFTANGWMGGEQQLVPALNGVLDISGEIEFIANGNMNGSLFIFMHRGGSLGDTEGYVSVTYDGETYQFTLPISDPDGDGLANEVTPTVEDDKANRVDARDIADPVPLSITPPHDGCQTLKDDPVETCMAQ